MKYTKKEVVELFNEYHKWTHLVTNVNEFLKEKGLIKEEFEFEVGKWYSDGDWLLCITEIKNGRVYFYGFKLDFLHDWADEGWFKNAMKPATDKEVETALIKEAKKRGFKEGAKIDDALGDNENIVEGFGMYYESGSLWATDNYRVYILFKKGKWATIIEEPKVKEMTMQEVNKALGYEIKIKE